MAAGSRRAERDRRAGLPRPLERRGRSRRRLGARRRRRPCVPSTISPVVGHAEHEAARERVAVDEPVEHDPGLPDRVALVVEAGAHRDQRLEVDPALAQLALVHRAEQRGREREQPERGQVDDRQRVRRTARPAGRRPAGSRPAACA